MKPRLQGNPVIVLWVLAAACPVYGQALVGSSFTYQGRLKDGTLPANGAYDFEFRLFDDDDAGVQVGTTKTSADLGVVDGLFTVKLDFGAVYTSNALWLEVSVRLGSSSGSYTKLLPRQELTGAPYALGVRLPLSESVSTSSDAFVITNTGAGDVAAFEVSNPASAGEALEAISNGGSDSQAFNALHTGAGDCGYFEITNAASGGEAVEGRTNGSGDALQGVSTGTGRAGYFQVDNPSSDAEALTVTTNGSSGSQAIFAEQTGTGDCGLFKIANSSSVGEAVEATSNGSGNSFQGINTGTGRAGYFQVDNDSSSAEALEVNSNGSDGSQAFYAKHTGTGDCGLFEIINGGSVGEALEARTNGGGDAVQAINSTSTGAGRAGYFEITGSLNDSPALQVQTSGPGMAILANDPVQVFGDDAEPDGGGYLILGDPASTSIAIDNNEIMARSAGGVSTLYLNNDGGDVNVGGPLLVRDKVLCEELEVQLEEDWPDFVFEDGYDLMPLHEVEAAIRAEGHLPGLPSACTIREEGLQIGSMQVGLLRKVEELTLHLIELDKQLATLQGENAMLQQRVSALSSGTPNTEVNP